MRSPPQSATLEQMRNERVYSQADLPGIKDSKTPLRALRGTIGPDAFAVLLLHRSVSDFRAADSALLSRLAPYLCLAMASWRALGQERYRAALDRRIAQNLGGFWMLLTLSGQVVDMSPDLRKRITSLTPLKLLANGWLEFTSTRTAHAFRKALEAALRGSGVSSIVELTREPPLVMVLHEEKLDDGRILVATLRFGPSAQSLPVERVVNHFGLSRSEARLTMLLCDGFSLQDAARELGWTIETTRSNSKRIFARMAVNGQPSVIRKVLTSAIWFSTEY